MDAKDIRNLSEAYLEVYSELDEAKVEAGASDVVKKDVRSRRFVGSKGEKNYDAMGPTASNWVSAARLRAHKAARGVKKEDFEIDEAYKDLPVGKMMHQVGKKKFKSGMDVGYEIGKGKSDPETEKRRDRYANQTGKMTAVASIHSPESSKAKSRFKKG